MGNLRADKNRMVVVGKVHSIDLEERLSKKGDQMIMGNVKVLVRREQEENLIELKVIAMHYNKNYKALQTIMNEYKTITNNGEEEADIVKVTGRVELNEYEGNDGMVKSFNVCNGSFFTRLKPSEYTGDMAILEYAGVYMGSKEVLDNEGLPMGKHEITIFSRTYNGVTKENDKINALKGLHMSNEIFDYFDGSYAVGDKVLLEIDIHRGAIVKEVETQKGFGRQPIIQNTSYRWDYEIVGGTGMGEASPEEMEELQRLRRVQLASITGGAPMETEGKGFGRTNTINNTTNNAPSFDMGDDLPF